MYDGMRFWRLDMNVKKGEEKWRAASLRINQGVARESITHAFGMRQGQRPVRTLARLGEQNWKL